MSRRSPSRPPARRLTREELAQMGLPHREGVRTSPPLDLRGQTYGQLTPITLACRQTTSIGRAIISWTCRCTCGRTRDVPVDHLRSGQTWCCHACGRLAQGWELTPEQQAEEEQLRKAGAGIGAAARRAARLGPRRKRRPRRKLKEIVRHPRRDWSGLKGARPNAWWTPAEDRVVLDALEERERERARTGKKRWLRLVAQELIARGALPGRGAKAVWGRLGHLGRGKYRAATLAAQAARPRSRWSKEELARLEVESATATYTQLLVRFPGRTLDSILHMMRRQGWGKREGVLTLRQAEWRTGYGARALKRAARALGVKLARTLRERGPGGGGYDGPRLAATPGGRWLIPEDVAERLGEWLWLEEGARRRRMVKGGATPPAPAASASTPPT